MSNYQKQVHLQTEITQQFFVINVSLKPYSYVNTVRLSYIPKYNEKHLTTHFLIFSIISLVLTFHAIK